MLETGQVPGRIEVAQPISAEVERPMESYSNLKVTQEISSISALRRGTV